MLLAVLLAVLLTVLLSTANSEESCFKRLSSSLGRKWKIFHKNCIDFAIKPYCLLQCNGHDDVPFAIMDDRLTSTGSKAA